MHNSTTKQPSSAERLAKLIQELVLLYEIDPIWVKNDILRLRVDIKLNKKLKENVHDPKKRRLIYKGMDFYRVLRKQGKGHDKACKITEVHYDLPEGIMKSVIASRNGFSRAKF